MTDLLSDYKQLPQRVLDLLDQFELESESSDSYAAAARLSQKLRVLGYSVDYGPDGVLYDLVDTNRESSYTACELRAKRVEHVYCRSL